MGVETAHSSVSGSSPLTRGKLPGENDPRAGSGLIPAHAGKTGTSSTLFTTERAHPRSRGENPPPVRIGVADPGSSPLTRGKPAVNASVIFAVGLIPAHAGKTRSCRARGRDGAAHPRSRGENSTCARKALASVGSSPLTRGKPRVAAQSADAEGLIPAHAGKTRSSATARRSPTAHPRSRGENCIADFEASAAGGSSPLTRGKLDVINADYPERRLIPAHAGKTLPDLRFYCADRSDLGNP